MKPALTAEEWEEWANDRLKGENPTEHGQASIDPHDLTWGDVDILRRHAEAYRGRYETTGGFNPQFASIFFYCMAGYIESILPPREEG